MNIRAMRSLRTAGASWAGIARETGCDYRTVKKYLADGAPSSPPKVTRSQHPPKVIEPYAAIIDGWLEREPRLRGTVIHERLVTEHGFAYSYQRVKMYLAEARDRVNPQSPELHRRFEVLPGAQAQVDWGDEGVITTPFGPLHVYSFHMTLSHSRDPFTCFVASQDLASFWACHVRAFHHFGGVPASILYDRTKTVVKRHVGRNMEVPLHPEALAFGAHYGFAITVAAAYRPQAKGRVERQVLIVREHVLMGRVFETLVEMDSAFTDWLPTRRAQVHRTHGQVIAVRAEIDRAALGALPASDYVVCERHLRSVAKDCLVGFESSFYSLPWRCVRRPMRVELRVTSDEVAIHRIGGDGALLASHARARTRGSWVVAEAHWDGLPRGATTDPPQFAPDEDRVVASAHEDVSIIATRSRHAGVVVAHRDLAFYDTVAVAS
jgi:transposase